MKTRLLSGQESINHSEAERSDGNSVGHGDGIENNHRFNLDEISHRRERRINPNINPLPF